jgi:hypothetical protein
MKALAPLSLAALLWAAPAQLATCLETEATLDFLPAASLRETGGQSVQTEATRLLAQAAASHKQNLAEGLSLSGTLWVDADSLPSGSPLETPGDKIELSSRVLELGLEWEALPGQLVLDAGKKIIHPSSGFFKTPLNMLSRGATSGMASSSGAAVSTWEEGWVGADLTWIAGKLSIANFISPRLAWSDGADRSLKYLSLRQDEYNDLLRVGLRLGDADLRFLALASSEGAGGSDPKLRFQAGSGLDINLGDSLTLRAESSVADSKDRLTVVDEDLLAIRDESVRWAPRALLGFTWAGKDDLSVMAEYYYNGLGLVGSGYRELIDYSSKRLAAAGSPGADLLDQYGSFEAARHYLFARVAGTLDTRLTASLWSAANLQDFSGMTGATLAYTRDSWAATGSVTDDWGGKDTEAGLNPLLWRLDLGMSLFF